MLADRPLPDDPATPRYLDLGLIATPAVALATPRARRSAWPTWSRPCWQGSRELLGRDDRRLAVRLRRMDDVLDRLHVAMKRFLSELAQARLSEEERDRLVWIWLWRSTSSMPAISSTRACWPSPPSGCAAGCASRGWELAELEAMHEHLTRSYASPSRCSWPSDLQAALRLVEEKERFRDRERASTGPSSPDCRRAGGGSRPAASTSTRVRDLKRIEA